MKHFKILLITSEFPPLPGGIGNHAYMLANHLQKEGYAITVLTDYRLENDDVVFDAQQNHTIVRVKRNLFTYFNRIRKGIALAQQNELIIASGKFSLWLAGVLKLLFPQKKYIAILHGTELRAGNALLQGFTKWSLTQFDTCIAVSNYTKKAALALHPSLPVAVINNGIAIKLKAAVKIIDQQNISLVTVGNLTFRKGQQNVISALPLLLQTFSNLHYHCIGISTQMHAFSTLANKLGVQEHITFHGALSDANKNKILEESTVFVMLSDEVKNDFEGFGIAVLEANSMGIPAIGSENSGIADAIKNNFSGVLVPPHQPELILNALIAIVNNYHQYSANALSWSAQFDWTLVVQNYIRVIEK